MLIRWTCTEPDQLACPLGFADTCHQPEDKPKPVCQEVKDNGDGTCNRYKQPGNLAKPKKHVFTWTKVVPGNSETLK